MKNDQNAVSCHGVESVLATRWQTQPEENPKATPRPPWLENPPIMLKHEFCLFFGMRDTDLHERGRM